MNTVDRYGLKPVDQLNGLIRPEVTIKKFWNRGKPDWTHWTKVSHIENGMNRDENRHNLVIMLLNRNEPAKNILEPKWTNKHAVEYRASKTGPRVDPWGPATRLA